MMPTSDEYAKLAEMCATGVVDANLEAAAVKIALAQVYATLAVASATRELGALQDIANDIARQTVEAAYAQHRPTQRP